MYLSRIEIDPARRATMVALTAPQKIHGAIESAFSGERRRKLWRIDKVGNKYWLLILSEDAADFAAIAGQFGPAKACCETRAYEPLLQRIVVDSVWRFRLTANPTKSCSNAANPKARGVVRAHCTVDYQTQWLEQRAEKNGFCLLPDCFTVTHSQWYRFHKGKDLRRAVSLLSVTYEGILKVTDPERFRAVLTNGIGRGKAYGMGLLTVMRAGDNYD